MASSTTRVRRAPIVPSTGGEWTNALENPEAANAAIKEALSEANHVPMPSVPLPSDDVVNLPGGLVLKDKIIRQVQVKELTGEDEESLARASQSSNPFVFLDRLLKCGVVRIGDEPAADVEKLLPQLLIGDREATILGIRRVTYGDKLDVEEWICTNCNAKADLEMELSDIPVTGMADPLNEVSFKVDLRKGGYAVVRLANGGDQLAIFEKPEITQAQRETILLSRCVTHVADKDGHELPMAAFPSMSRTMSVPDRHAILRELRDRQPGPKYDKVSYVCSSCDSQQNVVVTIGNLFLDFGWV